MKRALPWLLVLILFGGFAATAFLVLQARADAGRDMPAYSVYSEEPVGLAETARLLGKLGWEPVALTRPVSQLRPGPEPRLLIMVEPQPTGFSATGEPDLSPAEVRSLQRWVEEGNTLLLAGRHPNG